jgi:exodeoxyribonuclease V alpha subunit
VSEQKPKPVKAMLTDLQGQIEQVVYRNEENGYTIARVKVSDRKKPVTIVGNLLSSTPGEILIMQGQWTNHPKYGEQFKISDYDIVTPASVHGIEKYLGSGLIKGIGPVMAKRIVEKFSKKTLDVIEKETSRLSEVEGIGTVRIEMIKRSWEEQKEIRNVMLFLQTHDVSSGYATKIFRQYGSQSIKVVKGNPYRLSTDIFGIGFISADRIAAKLGIPKDSSQRVEAGILYVLQQQSDDGHVYYPYEPLIKKCMEILDVERDVVKEAFGNIALKKKIVIEDLNQDLQEFRSNNKAVYLAKYHLCETGIAEKFKGLVNVPKSIKEIDPHKALNWVQTKLSITLAEKQIEAIKHAIKHKVTVITGGPGTGKTTIIHAILKIYSQYGMKILLAAPTGRAAKRLSETAGREAKTIHRMLKYSVGTGEFEKNEHDPLECDLLILDEASMIDTILMYHLLKAVPQGATFILVGDVDQLPAVGAGNVLKDIISSGAVPVVELNEIFRQAKQSQIIVNAHQINSGTMPLLKSSPEKLEDFYFIEKGNPEDVLKTILELTAERIPARFGFDPVDDIQVLTPMHRGMVGTENLNSELQKVLNPGQVIITKGSQGFCINDKVMQIKNNYDREVFNGDIGKITGIDPENHELTVSFDNRYVRYDYTDLDEIILAYAVSVHKSQGSEFPAVVIPVLTQHYIMLQRNLIYTGVTRGKKLVVMVGTKKALSIGIKNDKPRKRYTCLMYRLGR